MKKTTAATLVTCLMAIASPAYSQQLQITVENLQPTDGFYFTPTWFGLHDGSFDVFDVGSNASTQLEALAEGGDTAPLSTLFTLSANAGSVDTTVTAPAGFAGAPVFDPGDSVTIMLNAGDTTVNRYLNYASMIIPSNDAFFGNDMALEIYNAAGAFTGTKTINIYGSSLYDSGTELNDTMGAPFSAIGGTSTDENMAIASHVGLDNFIGSSTPAGTTLANGIAANELVGRITISQVPEPSSAALLSLAAPIVMLARRRR